MQDHCLFVCVHGVPELLDTMGATVTTTALESLNTALIPAVDNLLQHHRIELLPRCMEQKNGQWTWFFRCSCDNTLLSDTAFAEAILSALNAQLGVLARNVFGPATARLARLEATLLPAANAISPHNIEQAFTARATDMASVDALEEQCLHDLLNGPGPRIFLQPIVRLTDQSLIGFEALSRGAQGSVLERADRLFSTAYHCGLGHALEEACIHAALVWRKKIPAELLLSINVSVPVLAAPNIQALMAQPGILVELTEHLPLGYANKLLPTLTRLHAAGARIALDDTGCGFADLQAAKELRPDYVKFCITIINALGKNPDLLAELDATVKTLHGLGCKIIAEGVENPETAELLTGLGIDYAQGWLFGRPAPANEWLER